MRVRRSARVTTGAQGDERLGYGRGRSGVIAFAAHAAALAGRWDEARRHLDEAFAFVDDTGERLHLPHLLLLRARIAHAQGDAAESARILDACRQAAQAHEAHWTGLQAELFHWEIARPGKEASGGSPTPGLSCARRHPARRCSAPTACCRSWGSLSSRADCRSAC